MHRREYSVDLTKASYPFPYLRRRGVREAESKLIPQVVVHGESAARDVGDAAIKRKGEHGVRVNPPRQGEPYEETPFGGCPARAGHRAKGVIESIAHGVTLLAVDRAQVLEMALKPPLPEEDGDQALTKHVGARVHALLGVNHSANDLRRADAPAHTNPRTDELGERVHTDDPLGTP